MTDHYTMQISNNIGELVDSEAAGIWADLELLGGETDSEKWNAKLRNIAGEYLLSARFALARILSDRIGMDFPMDNPELAFLGSPSMEHARNLTPEEHIACMDYLLAIAGPSPENDPDLHERILARAWLDRESASAVMEYKLPESILNNPKQRKKYLSGIEAASKKNYGTILTRDEALQLGHILKFTYQEMQWYLLRVFDTGDSLRLNRSEDLIEAYCFLTGASCARAEEIKQQYRKISEDIPKKDDRERSRNWTQQTADSLMENAASWIQQPQMQDAHFLSWMKQRASGLDIPSRTARRVYRNLAAYAYDFTAGRSGTLSDDMWDDLLRISGEEEETGEVREYLYRDGNISEESCAKVAAQLYLDNKTLSEQKARDNTTMWSVITTRPDRDLSVSSGVVNSGRKRILSLLMGEEAVEKGDLLYLLWYTLNLDWSDSFDTDPDVTSKRIFDLKDAAAVLLDSAMLPPFYPPHLMEQSMLLSIIYAGKTGTDPGVVYGSVLQSVRKSRERSAGSRRHTLQEKIDIITHYRDAGMTLKECALLYGVSEKTISQWQKKLLADGLIGTTVTL